MVALKLSSAESDLIAWLLFFVLFAVQSHGDWCAA
jgi:hypothetical protein